jgi:hypothetical protein
MGNGGTKKADDYILFNRNENYDLRLAQAFSYI